MGQLLNKLQVYTMYGNLCVHYSQFTKIRALLETPSLIFCLLPYRAGLVCLHVND